jgi:hypothetical protein
MSDLTMALLIWLPLGTLVPFFLSKLTGSDWRGAFIEASIFATMGLLVFPILLALTMSLVTTSPNVDVIFGISYVLAVICLLLFRRQTNRSRARSAGHYRNPTT